MTVASFLTADRSSPSIVLQRTAKPTLRASSFFQTSSGGIAITWPSGTVEGDMVVVMITHDYAGSAPTGWSTAFTTGTSNTTGMDGSCYYKVMTAADITAGGVTFGRTSSGPGRAAVFTYQDGANISVSGLVSNKTTGTDASLAVPYAGLNTATYLIAAGQFSGGAVSFGTSPVTYSTTTADSRGSSFGVYEPSADNVVSETASFASSSNPFVFVVVVTKGVGELIAASTAISAASEGTRWATGNFYFESVVRVLAGQVSIGFASAANAFGAATLGETLNSIAYNANGTVRINAVTVATLAPFVKGDRISVAVDRYNQLAYFRVNNGSWNNNGSADPLTGVGGISIANMNRERYYPACGFSVASGSVQFFFAASSFTYTPPTGFISVEEVQVMGAHNPVPVPGIAGSGYFTPEINFHAAFLPQDLSIPVTVFPAGPVKVIAGEVREDGVGVEGKLVRIYNRRTGNLVGEARTNATGDYVIPTQDPDLPHFVVAFDDPEYNAKVFDNVMPG